MKMSLGKYRVNRDFIISHFEANKRRPVVDLVSELAVVTMVPCICVAYYIGEHIGFTPEVNKIIKRLTDFYGYSEVKE